MKLLKKTKHLSVFVCILALGFFLMECKKTKEAEPEDKNSVPESVQPVETSASKFSQLKVGNYWIYDVTYWFNSSTPEPYDTIPRSTTDSCYISKDTLINGRRFFEIRSRAESNSMFHRYIRDSLSYIVDSKSGILFSSHYFNAPIKDWYLTNTAPIWAGDTVYHGQIRMTGKEESVTVPAGTFLTYNAQVSRNYKNLYRDPRKPNPRLSVTKYAANVGMVYQFISDGTITDVERKLKRYRVN